MENIIFTDEGHVYKNEKGEIYDSVSRVWKPYFPEFNAEEISLKKGISDVVPGIYDRVKRETGYFHKDFIQEAFKLMNESEKKFAEMAASDYREEWSNKALRGTRFHSFKENIDLVQGGRENPSTGLKYDLLDCKVDLPGDNTSLDYDLLKSVDRGYVPEALLHSTEHRVAGQADMLFVEKSGDTIYVDIDDWKTDNKIERKPFFFSKNKTLKFPFDHIYDTNLWKYAMKISTYAYLLELRGFTVRNLFFTHVDVKEESEGEFTILDKTRYKIPYKRFEVELLFNSLL